VGKRTSYTSIATRRREPPRDAGRDRTTGESRRLLETSALPELRTPKTKNPPKKKNQASAGEKGGGIGGVGKRFWFFGVRRIGREELLLRKRVCRKAYTKCRKRRNPN